MFRLSHYRQISNAVVTSISIDVMDNFGLEKLSSYAPFNNTAMFKDASAVNSDFEIAIWNDSPCSARPDFGEQWVSMFIESLIMDIAKPMGFICLNATRDCAKEISFSFCHSFPDVWIPILSSSLEMHGTEIPASGWAIASMNGAIVGYDIPPETDGLYHENASPVKRNHHDNWVNSGEPLAGHAEGNPERSRGYTPETCRDYRRGIVPLITGLSAQPEREEIVRSAWKHAANIR